MAPAPIWVISNGTASSDSQESNVVCKATSWTDLLVFYGVNYLAHAATMKTLPGESVFEKAFTMAYTLLLPATSVFKAASAIRRIAIKNGRSELRGAARAGALCTVIRSETWKPHGGDRVVGLDTHSDVELGDKAGEPKESLRTKLFRLEMFLPRGVADMQLDTAMRAIHLGSTKVQGTHLLPDGYELAFLPPDVEFERPSDRAAIAGGHAETIASTHSIPKIIIAASQIIYAGTTLWQSRWDQIDRYGYAAFGLTVTPYLVMSLINLLAQLLTPDYETLFLVTSEISDEAERRGGLFQGAVARLKPPEHVGPVGIFTRSPPISADSSPTLYSVEREASATWTVQPASSLLERHHHPDAVLRVPQCMATSEGCRYDKAADDREWRKMDCSYLVILSSVFFFALLNILVVGGLSRFQAGSSTLAQRAWAMTWLAEGHMGGMLGFQAYILQPYGAMGSVTRAHTKRLNPGAMSSSSAGTRFLRSLSPLAVFFLNVLVGLPWAVPAIGGFVNVGQMLYEHGSCTHI